MELTSWLHQRLQPQRPELNSYDLWKCVALAAMILDHAGRFLFPEQEWLRVAGRVAFPVFFFLIGYSGRFGFDKTLFALACLLALLDGLTGHPVFPLDILASILVTRAAMAWLIAHPRWLAQPGFLLFGLFIWHLPLMALTDYGTLGLAFALAGYAHRHTREASLWRVFTLATWLWYAAMQWLAFEFTPLMLAAMALLLTATAAWLFRFRLMPVLPATHPVAFPLKLFARLSLHWYALHFVLFLLLDRTPHTPGQWVWLDPALIQLFTKP